MFKKTVNLNINSALADAILATLSAVPGAELWDAPEVKLFSNDVTFNPATVLGDLTECTFTGYAAEVLGTLEGPVTLDNGARALHKSVDFVAGAVTPPGELAYGYYIVDTAGTTLYAGETFDEPVPFAEAGNFLSLEVVVPMARIMAAE